MVEKQPQKPQEGSGEKEYFNCTQYGENEVKKKLEHEVHEEPLRPLFKISKASQISEPLFVFFVIPRELRVIIFFYLLPSPTSLLSLSPKQKKEQESWSLPYFLIPYSLFLIPYSLFLMHNHHPERRMLKLIIHFQHIRRTRQHP